MLDAIGVKKLLGASATGFEVNTLRDGIDHQVARFLIVYWRSVLIGYVNGHLICYLLARPAATPTATPASYASRRASFIPVTPIS